jgi:DNA-directed RNA polymerase III subunit RPC1
VDLPTPAILKPVELWSGKQLFSVLVRPNASCHVFASFELTEKNYTKKGKHMCHYDGYVCFVNSELMCGQIGKGTLGNGTKQGLFSVINAEYGAEEACLVMNRIAKMSARFIGNRGFSIGIEDVTPSVNLVIEKQKTVNAGYAKCDEAMRQFKKGTLRLAPGCNAEETIEAMMNGELSEIREAAGARPPSVVVRV